MKNIKNTLAFIAVFAISSFCHAEDWLSYMNISHTELIERLGVPDSISASLDSSSVAYDDTNLSEGSYRPKDIKFYYKDKEVTFILDNQGGLRQYYRDPSVFLKTVDEYSKALGSDGELYVCGIKFHVPDKNLYGVLPYGINISGPVGEVLLNKSLGAPKEYSPEQIKYQFSVKDDNLEKRHLGKNVKTEAIENITVDVVSNIVFSVEIVRFHSFTLSFK